MSLVIIFMVSQLSGICAVHPRVCRPFVAIPADALSGLPTQNDSLPLCCAAQSPRYTCGF